jgi:hypothetical protein
MSKSKKTLSEKVHDLIVGADYKEDTTFILTCLEIDRKTGAKYNPFYKRATNLELLGLIDITHSVLEAEREEVLLGPASNKDTLDVAIDSVYKELYESIRQGLLSNNLNDVAIDFIDRLKSVKESINIDDLKDDGDDEEEYGTA